MKKSASSRVVNGKTVMIARKTRCSQVRSRFERASWLSWVCWATQKMPSVSRLRSQGMSLWDEASRALSNSASEWMSAGSGERKSSTSTVAAKAKMPSLSASIRPTSPPAKAL